MKKLSILITMLLIGLAWSPTHFVEASPDKKVGEHKHHHKLIDCEKAEELKEQGYSKQDIFMGAMLSKKTDKNIEDVLAIYKETQSWEKTAEKLGIDMEEFKRIDSMRQWEQFLKENKEDVEEYLAVYTKMKRDEIDAYLEEEIPLRFLIGAAALAKISGKKLDEIITYKKDGQSFHEIMETLNVNKEDLHKELENFKSKVQKTVNEDGDD